MNLAAKTLHVMPIIQPRLASLFEPPPGLGRPPTGHEPWADNAAGDHLCYETTSPASLVDPHQHQQAGISLVSTPRPQIFAAAPAHDAVETPADRRQPPLLAPQTNDIELSKDHSRQAPGVFQPTGTLTAAFIDRSTDQGSLLMPCLRQLEGDRGTGSAVTTSVQSGGGSGGEAAPNQNPPHQGADSPTNAADVLTLRTDHLETLSPQFTRPEPVAVKIVAQSSAAPVAGPTSLTLTEPTPTPAAAPVIRVSIGRIEVRAIMPPAPPAPRSKVPRPSPGLSLEEFLKQRQRGQR
jgi:hypothetical protein